MQHIKTTLNNYLAPGGKIDALRLAFAFALVQMLVGLLYVGLGMLCA